MVQFVSEKKFYSNSNTVLSRIARADQTAVRECVDLYGKMIWALAKQYTDSKADAERAVPEIFMDIWRHAAFCDLEISDEVVWIALIARRRLSAYVFKPNLAPPINLPGENAVRGYEEIPEMAASV